MRRGILGEEEDEEDGAREMREARNAGARGGVPTATATVASSSSSSSSSKAAVSEAGIVTATAGPMHRQQQQQQQQQHGKVRAAPAMTAVDKRSREYVLKSGLAGGLAGCAVCCYTRFQMILISVWQTSMMLICLYRPKRSLVPSIVLRSSFKHPTRTTPNTPAPGSALSEPCQTSTLQKDLVASFGAIRPLCSASSPMLPSSFLLTSRFARLSFRRARMRRC